MTFRAPYWLWFLWALSKDLAFLYVCYLIGRMVYQTALAIVLTWGLP